MNVRKNDKAVMLMVAEISGRPPEEIHTVEVQDGHVIVNTSFTMTAPSEEIERIEKELEKRVGRPVSLV